MTWSACHRRNEENCFIEDTGCEFLSPEDACGFDASCSHLLQPAWLFCLQCTQQKSAWNRKTVSIYGK